MATSGELRTKFNNEWPCTFLFESEQALMLRLSKKNITSIFKPAQFKNSQNQDFQDILSHCIDSLDHLPLRPDLAFDQLWKVLDAECSAVKTASGIQNESRFLLFANHVHGHPLTAKSHYSLASFVPLQTCEYLAKRLLESTLNPNQHSHAFAKRLAGVLGNSLLNAIHAKYDVSWLTQGQQGITLRKLGLLIQMLAQGNTININGNVYAPLSQKTIGLLMIGVIFPQFRNERFHATTRPPFRSSAASLKTYAHSYFLLIYAYSLILETLLYKNLGVISAAEAVDCTIENTARYTNILGDQLKS